MKILYSIFEKDMLIEIVIYSKFQVISSNISTYLSSFMPRIHCIINVYSNISKSNNE